MRILTVDDSGVVRLEVKRAVDVMGYELLEARDGQEGLDVLERENGHIDLILLDWNMPNMNGIEMLKAVKADSRFAGIPVTMVTTEVDRHRVLEALKCGAKNYVMKPFSQQDLIDKIMESLGLGE